MPSVYSLSWIYKERALINEQLARLPEADRLSLWWQAITYLERANLLEDDVLTWTYLSRYYRYLEKDSSARSAIGKALEIEAENYAALAEQVAILAAVGEVYTAEEVIDKGQVQEANEWLNAIKAYVLIYKGILEEHNNFYEEALKILDGVLQTTPEELWYHDLRGYCYLLLNEPLRAREEYEFIWEQYDPLNTDDLGTFGWAAYKLALSAKDSDEFNKYIVQAISIFGALCKEPIGVGNAYRNLGLSYLCRGDLARGEERLDKGIELATNKRELDEVQIVDFHDVEKVSTGWPYGAQVREILARLNEKINTKRIEVEQRPSSVEEDLKQVIEEYPREDGTINWAWIGAHAGLARLYNEEKRWSEAKTTYLLLQKEGERFPEAHLGLEKILEGLQEEADSPAIDG